MCFYYVLSPTFIYYSFYNWLFLNSNPIEFFQLSYGHPIHKLRQIDVFLLSFRLYRYLYQFWQLIVPKRLPQYGHP